jgi:hypothetical protein
MRTSRVISDQRAAMISARSAGILAVFLAATSALAQSGPKQSPLIVDLHGRRAEIRAALLRFSPIGSSLETVLEFVSNQLQRSANTPVAVENQPASGPAADSSPRRGVKRIRVYLGQYYDHPEVVFLSAPLMMQKEVSAQWAFDQHDRLIDIFVDRRNAVY